MNKPERLSQELAMRKTIFVRHLLRKHNELIKLILKEFAKDNNLGAMMSRDGQENQNRESLKKDRRQR